MEPGGAGPLADDHDRGAGPPDPAAGLDADRSDLPFAALLLAFVPGGIAEMGLVALALGQDVAFVSTHHVARVVLVIMLAPLAFRLLRRGR